MSIYFDNLEVDTGAMLILVQDEQAKDVAKLVLPIINKSSKADIFLVPGKYAITAFHDQNGNLDLDKNIVGIPTEPYGFSNNARSKFSRPDLEDMLIDLSEDKKVTFDIIPW